MGIFIRISILLLFLLSACNFPAADQASPDLTSVVDATLAPATDTPIPDLSSTECGFVWARVPLPDLSKEFDAALKAALPDANGSAEAYGENCINNQGEVVRFSAMETDFYVTLKVQSLEDKQTLGDLAEAVLSVIAQFPVESTPGPQPGYVGITFEAPTEELRLWFTQRDAETALGNGYRGEELFNTLQGK